MHCVRRHWMLAELEKNLGKWGTWYFTPLSESQLNTLISLLDREIKILRLDRRDACTWTVRGRFERCVESFYYQI